MLVDADLSSEAESKLEVSLSIIPPLVRARDAGLIGNWTDSLSFLGQF